jgi:sporulation protein YtfJ
MEGDYMQNGSHPIESIMKTTLENIRDMVDVNTIVGEAVSVSEGSVIIPVSRVSFGFLSGGGEYKNNMSDALKKYKERIDSEIELNTKSPFAGGAGAGITIQPVAFLVVSEGNIKLMSVDGNSSFEKIIDLADGLFNKFGKDNKKTLEKSSESNIVNRVEN